MNITQKPLQAACFAVAIRTLRPGLPDWAGNGVQSGNTAVEIDFKINAGKTVLLLCAV